MRSKALALAFEGTPFSPCLELKRADLKTAPATPISSKDFESPPDRDQFGSFVRLSERQRPTILNDRNPFAFGFLIVLPDSLQNLFLPRPDPWPDRVEIGGAASSH